MNFQKLLTSSNYGIFSKIAFNFYLNKIAEHPIGSGAFQLSLFDKQNILLIRNNDYWKMDKYGNKLIEIWLSDNGRPLNSMNPVEKLCFI